MKPIHLSILALAAGSAFAAEVYTPVVGYITHTVAGNTGLAADTYITPSLIQPTEFSAQSSSDPSGLTVVEFSGGVPENLDSAYLLEITSGDHEGWWSTVVSSTSTSITTNDSLPTGLPANTSISVRKHNTVGSFLGANSIGLTPFDGINPNDEVQVLNPALQVVLSVAYVPSDITGLPDGWFDLGASAPADDLVIEPGSSIKIVRFASSSLSFVSVGTVKTTATQVDIYPNFNWIGTHHPVGITFDNMNIASQLVTFDGVSAHDELQVLGEAQDITPFASLDPSFGLGVVMGNLLTSVPAGAVVFEGGAGAVLKRDSSGQPSTITIPGITIE